MKLRATAAVLCAALAAPLLAVPAAADDAIDPALLANLKSAFVAADSTRHLRGGTITVAGTVDLTTGSTSSGSASASSAATSAALATPAGIWRRAARAGTPSGRVSLLERLTFGPGITPYRNRTVVTGLLAQDSDRYLTPSGRTLAARVDRLTRVALHRHGMKAVPRYYRPAAGTSKVPTTSTAFPTDAVGQIYDDLLLELTALTVATDGEVSTYSASTSDDPGALTLTMVVTRGVLTSMTEGGVRMTLTYVHAPVVVPHATPRGRRVIAAETQLAAFAPFFDLVGGHKPRAKQVATLQRFFRSVSRSTHRLESTDTRHGVVVTYRLRAWKHPLVWRYTVGLHHVRAVPLRSA